MEVLTSMKPIQQMKKIHIYPAVPPLTRLMLASLYVAQHISAGFTDEASLLFLELFYTYTSEHSQDATKIIEKAHIDTKRKFRYRNVRVSPEPARWRRVYAP